MKYDALAKSIFDHHRKGAIKSVDAIARNGRDDDFALFLRNREYVKMSYEITRRDRFRNLRETPEILSTMYDLFAVPT